MKAQPDPKYWLKENKSLAGKRFQWVVMLSFLSGAFLIAHSAVLAYVLNAIIINKQGIADLSTPLVLFPIFVLLRAIVTRKSERIAFQAGTTIREHLHGELLEHIKRLGPVRVSRYESSGIGLSILEGVNALQDYYARYLPHMGIMLLVPMSILIVVAPLDWISALVFLITAPLIPFFMILIGKGAERINQKQWQKMARLGAYFLDVLRGLPTLKAFNLSKKEATFVASMSEDYRKSTLSVLRVAFLSSLMLEFLSTVSIAMIAVFIGFRLMWGEMEFLYGFFILLLAPEFYFPLRTMGVHYHARMQAVSSAQQIVEFLSAKPADSSEITEIIPITGKVEIEFDNVSYRYPGSHQNALSSVSLNIVPGEHVALVGASGSGKSTLVRLLMGFDQPAEGSIFINQINLASADPRQWLKQVSWIPQNPQLFHGTILDNIVMADRSGFDFEHVRKAVSMAGIEELINELPEGYETIVGEGGRPLSGGETQRVAIARALYKNSPLLVLDEPTASLDLITQAQINKVIYENTCDKSVVIIAHRLETVEKMDRIIVLDDGEVVETGTHTELLDREGVYAHMVNKGGRDV